MKQLFYYALFWMLSGGINKHSNAETTSTAQTFSKAQLENSENAVTENGSVRLKEIDALNPLFIFK